ncbi:transporter [Ganoderma sinense ZZ0214-1]|uniref:Transporter n=1 Tax=Ganoderma sinense ZZ0214-1 TaxID=1077348 RepID=A0A2G8RZC6_9APHY|nr:transporter [Ganoderma sinense ZZ0214-1]
MVAAIGIDLGTTRTCVCVWQNDLGVAVIPNDEGNRFTPSCVSFTDSECLVGDIAMRNITRNPHNTVFNVKRLLGYKFSDPSLQIDVAQLPFHVFERDSEPRIRVQDRGMTRVFSPEEILSLILAKVKEVAGLYLGGVVTSAIIAVPAHFNHAQRQAIKRAGTIAGLHVRIISETSACAIAYNLNNRSPMERNVVIFDLGGGSLDVSLLSIEGGVADVKATASCPHLGGEDFDARLVDHFATEFQRRHREDISGDARALLRLRAHCERAKRALSSSSRTTLEIDCLSRDGVDFVAPLTRHWQRFEALCEDLFQAALEPRAPREGPPRRAARQGACARDRVSRRVHAHPPRLKRASSPASSAAGGRQLHRALNPDEAVACGAAVHAAIVDVAGNTATASSASESESERMRDLLLLDCAPFALGVEGAGGVMVRALIARNARIPTRRSMAFTAHTDDQPGVFVRVYEDDGARTRETENHLLGCFVLDGIRPAPRGVPRIEVTFDFDSDNNLVVSVTDKGSGKEKRMSADAEEYYREPARRVAAKKRLEEYASGVRAVVKELEGALDDTDMWLAGAQKALREEYTQRHQGLEASASTAIEKLSALADANAEECSGARIVDETYLRSWQIARA